MMSLFGNNPTTNLLPFDGEVVYFGKILTEQNASTFKTQLLNTIEWRNDELVMYGKPMVTKRKIAWYGNEPYSYTYSHATKQAIHWTAELAELKQITEQITGETFNSCLVNLYHNGSEGVTWHSDDERMLKPQGTIASLTLGAERKFSFRHKLNKHTVSVLLEHGSLLLMKGTTQLNWQHCLPKMASIKQPRINLTFRTIMITT